MSPGARRAPIGRAPCRPAGEAGADPDATPSITSKMFTTVLPSFVDPGLEELLIDNGVEISAEPIQEGGSLWQTLLFGFGPALLLIGVFVWLSRRAQGGGGVGGALSNVGRSRARRYDQESETRVTFDDVGGSRVRDLFKQARENAPAIIFIDELDSIGRTRGQTVVGGSSEQEQTLNQILTEMDGFSSKEGVIVLAATNQPDVLDKALLRPGRFDRRVVVNLPDKVGREEILKVHTRGVPLAESVDLRELAASTPGLSGADLRNLVNEAALLAARREQDEVAQKDFLDALEKIALGPERPLMMSPDERERIAYHEGGHAILGLVVPGADPVNRVTIVPRGQALGVTYQRPEDDRYNYPEAYLRARIVGVLGGRTAEEIVYGTRTTGAENDIEQATDLARRMVTRWGMSEKLGMVQLAPRENAFLGGGYPSEKPFSEETARAVDEEVLRIIDESHKEACRLLTKHRNELELVPRRWIGDLSDAHSREHI